MTARNTETSGSDSLNIGWAFKDKKTKTVFTDVQKNFMKEKFNIGKHGGCKIDPFTAAEEMQTCNRFKKSDFLTGQQIAGYFSRLAQQDRKMDKQDFISAQDEETKCELKRDFLRVLEQ